MLGMPLVVVRPGGSLKTSQGDRGQTSDGEFSATEHGSPLTCVNPSEANAALKRVMQTGCQGSQKRAEYLAKASARTGGRRPLELRPAFAGRIDLDRDVFDAEAVVQHRAAGFRAPPAGRDRLSSTAWAESESSPLVMVQTCRSCTSRDAGDFEHGSLRSASRSRWQGVLSIRMAMACFTRSHEE